MSIRDRLLYPEEEDEYSDDPRRPSKRSRRAPSSRKSEQLRGRGDSAANSVDHTNDPSWVPAHGNVLDAKVMRRALVTLPHGFFLDGSLTAEETIALTYADLHTLHTSTIHYNYVSSMYVQMDNAFSSRWKYLRRLYQSAMSAVVGNRVLKRLNLAVLTANNDWNEFSELVKSGHDKINEIAAFRSHRVNYWKCPYRWAQSCARVGGKDISVRGSQTSEHSCMLARRSYLQRQIKAPKND